LQKQTGIPNLTGIRGLAALWVVVYHVQQIAAEFGLPGLHGEPAAAIGWTAVDLFFLLSGFILYHVHGDEFRSLKPQTLAAFTWLRIWRIYPLASAVLLLILLLTLADPNFFDWLRRTTVRDGFTPATFFRTLSLSTRWWHPYVEDWNQPVWSLSAEIVGYAIFPFFASILGRLRPATACIAAIVLIGTPWFLLSASGHPVDNYIEGWALIRMACYFIGGVALSRVCHALPSPNPGTVDVLGYAVIGGIALTICLPQFVGGITYLFAILILVLAFQTPLLSPLFSNRVVLFLGRISFPVYLLQIMSLRWAEYLVLRHGITTPTSTVILCL
jgi:peptidoglycan/LPS O-acetylase OafA/YrhL